MVQGEIIRACAIVAVSAALAAVLILAIKPLLVRYILAHPNARSSHSRATPQGAGVAVLLAFLAALLAARLVWPELMADPTLLPVLLGAIGLSALGLADDAKPLPASWRFAAQTLAAVLLAWSLPTDLRVLPDLLPLWAERALIAFGAIYLVNVINFLDGIDWITAAQVVPMTLGIAVLAYLGAVPPKIGVAALALLGAMLGFAYFNKHPAQIFLGDAGSLPIGLLIAFMLAFVAGANLAAALLLPLYTLLDSGITLMRRSYRRERIFEAHRSHFYQRAVIRGMTPPQVTARVFVLGLFLAVLAILAVILASPLAGLLLLVIGVAATTFVLASLASLTQ